MKVFINSIAKIHQVMSSALPSSELVFAVVLASLVTLPSPQVIMMVCYVLLFTVTAILTGDIHPCFCPFELGMLTNSWSATAPNIAIFIDIIDLCHYIKTRPVISTSFIHRFQLNTSLT
ncbi:hypothetical protein GHT06_007965 [Daphnia sinensis]|uniref:Uncharacterized protein n=1 Tax=Daphnia sinensis TaxID=1820382 RepID=A0AAD5PYJ7_9CRUS|nr:hypothetical protein GHT06_007965 [Daphnia sinensis]